MVELLWALFISVGLWLLFPKGFKYWVGCLVGTMGALFFWGLFIVFYGVQNLGVSAELFWWTLGGFLAVGNVLGFMLAAKG